MRLRAARVSMRTHATHVLSAALRDQLPDTPGAPGRARLQPYPELLRRAGWLRQAELLLLLAAALLGGGCEALVAAAAVRLLAVLTDAAAWKCNPPGSAPVACVTRGGSQPL